MHNPNLMAHPISMVTQDILWLGKNGVCEDNHIIVISLKPTRLYALIRKPRNILKDRKHVNDMVIPDLLIL